MKKKKNKEVRINIRVPQDEKDELKQVASQTKITETMIVRHALKKALPELRSQFAAGEGVAIVI